MGYNQIPFHLVVKCYNNIDYSQVAQDSLPQIAT